MEQAITAEKTGTKDPNIGFRRKREIKKFITGVLFASPVIIGVLLFTFWPAVQSLYYSFTDYDIFNI